MTPNDRRVERSVSIVETAARIRRDEDVEIVPFVERNNAIPESTTMHRLRVVDNDGRFVGVIAQADVPLRATDEHIGALVEDISK